MKDFISEFGLTFEQSLLLFSLERQIVKMDIIHSQAEGKQEEAARKQEWLNSWDSHINDFLNNLDGDSGERKSLDIAKIDSKALYEKIRNEETTNKIKAWRYLILLECTLFTPYFPFDISSDEEEGLIDKVKKIFDKLSLNKDSQKTSLVQIALLLEIDIKYVDIFRKRYEEAIKSLSGFWKKVLISGGIGMIAALAIVAVFLTPIAVAFAAPGLYGAAAFSAGMAALGGGAIAAGGFGMAGGFAVLVGGAIILGGSTGAGIGTLASSSPKLVLTELAKIEVVLREIIMGMQHDTKLLQDIILQLGNNMNEMQTELAKLKFEEKKNKEKIKNLEEAIEYMKKAMDEFTKMK